MTEDYDFGTAACEQCGHVDLRYIEMFRLSDIWLHPECWDAFYKARKANRGKEGKPQLTDADIGRAQGKIAAIEIAKSENDR